MNLGGWSCRDQEGQALGRNGVDNYLNFKRSVVSSLRRLRTDLKSVEEGKSCEWIVFAVRGNESDDLLTWKAGRKSSSVDLIITCHNTVGSLCEEREGYSAPASVAPLGSDDKGDDTIAIWVDSFDGEEEIVAGETLEIMNSWISNKVPIATLGEQSKGLVRV